MKSNLTEEILKQHVAELDSCFVFPTQMAADLWADRITLVSDTKAVASERFIAWDDFKGTSIKSRQQEKRAIPSQLRKIFVVRLISENAESPFFKDLIVPDYAKNASGFASSISSLLPSLRLWKEKFDALKTEGDDEDKDLLLLYEKYKDFLDSHELFEPAWETPPFKKDGWKYFIFYPEILSDYMEYKTILESAEDVTVINLPQVSNSDAQENIPECKFFSNSRIELKNVAIYLRKLHDEQKISWQDMAVSVPDLKSVGNYIDRELELYRIPHVLRSSKPLSSTGAGAFFSLVQNAVQNNFDYASIMSLVLNQTLPWQDREKNLQLIDFGRENNCLVNFEYNGKKIDVWKESLLRGNPPEGIKEHYEKLRYGIEKLAHAKTFSELRAMYFMFKNDFFNMDDCPAESDRILSRCISELGLLIDLEEEFTECKVPSPLGFFIEHLDSKDYLEQTDSLGVQVLPYKTAAAAPFMAHVIIDSSQTSLSVVYKDLSFLREDKRRIFLQAEDPNVSSYFIRLYDMNSLGAPACFTCAQKTFSGYAQVSSDLKEVESDDETEKEKTDLYGIEKLWFKDEKNQKEAEFPKKITDTEESGFTAWKQAQHTEEEIAAARNPQPNGISKAKEIIIDAAKPKIYVSSENSGENLIKISYTEMKEYLKCPRSFLMSRITKIAEQKNEADLIDRFAMGNLYHKILELYCSELKNKSLPLKTTLDGLEKKYEEILYQKVDEAIKKSRNSFLAKELITSSADSLKSQMKKMIERFSELFLDCEIVETETEYSYQIPGTNIQCIGQLDCLLADDDEYILVDFKSSAKQIPENVLYEHDESKTENEQELPDFQMPMYIYLLENQRKSKKVENCCFFNITANEVKYVIGEKLYARIKKLKPRTDIQCTTFQNFEETMKVFKSTVLSVTEQISSYDFSLEKIMPDYGTCSKCNYSAVCRKVFNVGRTY